MSIQSLSVEEIEKIFNSSPPTKQEKIIAELINILETTESPIRRNELALLLSDISKEKAVDPIIRMLKDPKTLGYRGTLLYALEKLDYTQYLDFIFGFVFDNKFEVSRQSAFLIEKALSEKRDLGKTKDWSKEVTKRIEIMEEELDFLNSFFEVLENYSMNK